jgi:hypothetical protein
VSGFVGGYTTIRRMKKTGCRLATLLLAADGKTRRQLRPHDNKLG